jgi:hypothetical protein
MELSAKTPFTIHPEFVGAQKTAVRIIKLGCAGLAGNVDLIIHTARSEFIPSIQEHEQRRRQSLHGPQIPIVAYALLIEKPTAQS